MDYASGTASRSPALQYDGRIGELYQLFLLNILFTILTLGIFRFWAITRYRRYFWSRMRFQHERFEYTGTGGELIIGFLLAGLVLLGGGVVVSIIGGLLSLIWPPLMFVPIVAYGLFIVLLAFGAVFSAQRYRLSRTQWCGIRGGMTGSMVQYGAWSLLYAVCCVLTLFQLVPWTQVRLAEKRINASSFGSARFSFQGRAGRLYLAYLATLAGVAALFAIVAGAGYAAVHSLLPLILAPSRSIPEAQQARQLLLWLAEVLIPAYLAFLIGASLIGCWYSALFERHVVGHTTLAGMRFSSTMSGPALLLLVAGNILIVLCTLGLGFPILLHRNARFLARTLWVEGAVDVRSVTQSTIDTPRFGEGMFQQLDHGVL